MKTALIFSLSLIALALQSLAAELPALLARDLIVASREIAPGDVKIAYQLNGQQTTPEGFTSGRAICVVALVASTTEGDRAFRKENIIFQHSEDLGWFLTTTQQIGNDETLRIFSSKQGEIWIK